MIIPKLTKKQYNELKNNPEKGILTFKINASNNFNNIHTLNNTLKRTEKKSSSSDSDDHSLEIVSIIIVVVVVFMIAMSILLFYIYKRKKTHKFDAPIIVKESTWSYVFSSRSIDTISIIN